jgi:transposase
MGTTRYLYNKGVAKIRSGELRGYGTPLFQQMRNSWVTSKSRKGVKNPEIEKWQLETPKDIRAESLRDLSKNMKNGITRVMEKKISKFQINFKKKKQTNQSIVIPSTGICKTSNGFRIFPKYLGKKDVLVGKRTFQKWWCRKDFEITSQCRLVWDGTCFKLHIPIKNKIKIRIPKRHTNSKIVALDPGLRTFLTGFGTDGICKIHRDPQIVEKYRKRISTLQSLRKGIKKQRILHKKIIHWVDDLHYKAADFLEKEYEGVLLPLFETQKMRRSIHSKKVQGSFSLFSHYKFRCRLKEKNLKVYEVNEAYTSKTCSGCGKIDFELGSKKNYSCTDCGLRLDRDINGARNILIKHLTPPANVLSG